MKTIKYSSAYSRSTRELGQLTYIFRERMLLTSKIHLVYQVENLTPKVCILIVHHRWQDTGTGFSVDLSCVQPLKTIPKEFELASNTVTPDFGQWTSKTKLWCQRNLTEANVHTIWHGENRREQFSSKPKTISTPTATTTTEIDQQPHNALGNWSKSYLSVEANWLEVRWEG